MVECGLVEIGELNKCGPSEVRVTRNLRSCEYRMLREF